MEEGSMRVDANVSVRPVGAIGARHQGRDQEHELAAVARARDRATRSSARSAPIESGERIVQETRHWDEADGRTALDAHEGGLVRLPLLPRARPRAGGARPTRCAPAVRADDARAARGAPGPARRGVGDRRGRRPGARRRARAGRLRRGARCARSTAAPPKDVVNWCNGDVLGVPQRDGAVAGGAAARARRSRRARRPRRARARSRATRRRTCSPSACASAKRPKQVVDERGPVAGERRRRARRRRRRRSSPPTPTLVDEYRAGDDKVRKKKRRLVMGLAMKATRGQGNGPLLRELIQRRLEG